MDPSRRALYHRAAENLRSWCSRKEIDSFLADSSRIQAFGNELIRSLTVVIDESNSQEFFDVRICTNKACCWECTGPMGDADEVSSLLIVVDDLTYMHPIDGDSELVMALHKATICMALACSLLARPRSDLPLQVLVYDIQQEGDSILSACDKIFFQAALYHKLSQFTMALVSIIVARQPTARRVMVPR